MKAWDLVTVIPSRSVSPAKEPQQIVTAAAGVLQGACHKHTAGHQHARNHLVNAEGCRLQGSGMQATVMI